ncbi:Glycosyl transferase family 2 [Lentzea xinjiangensis]|uniref:Glycosyl transferase family 2 n=1 Tax=Lentzea xinjiangensis TaxID=402600 RepID=A0A1H9W0Q5_9PSEU|nr:glycosyltransferase [Lentzea xinjiangensis]SES27247.1 Glycosyl transferase family 2 [Lentzea xinjiangensis]
MRGPVEVEVVIPAFNEAARLPDTLDCMVGFLDTRPWSARIVVVDNGSYDDTSAVAGSVHGRTEVVTIGCAQAGKGAAVLRGMRTSSARYVGFTDADLSTPVTTLVDVLAELRNGAAAAIASRHAPGGAVVTPRSLMRRIGSQVFRAVARPLVPGVHDTQCGFKFFDRHAVTTALARCRNAGFAFDVELLRHIHADGLRIAEVPVTWTDSPGSTFHSVRDGIAAVAAVCRMHGTSCSDRTTWSHPAPTASTDAGSRSPSVPPAGRPVPDSLLVVESSCGWAGRPRGSCSSGHPADSHAELMRSADSARRKAQPHNDGGTRNGMAYGCRSPGSSSPVP